MFKISQQATAECGQNLSWSGEQKAAVLIAMRSLTDLLHEHLQNECRDAEPQECPEPEIPANGGLACAKVDGKHYCKPLCNHGYDFSFLRRSRVFDECTSQTRHKWNTQYVGGNKLAVCNEASIPISGTNTAYFPQGQDCLTTVSSGQQRDAVLRLFVDELKAHGIDGKPQHLCLVCGRT